jgi:CRISPR-associated endonuclease/helicase Cas3
MDRARTLYAHTLDGRPPAEWEPLDVHAAQVARLARSFASAFGAGDWGDVLGRWHDLGKGSDDFQSYLFATHDPDAAENESAPGRVDHSTFGAQHAVRTVSARHFAQLLAFCIAGHHGSMPDAFSDDELTRGSTLQARLKKDVPAARVSAEDQLAPKLGLPFTPERENAGFQIAFFTRMLFSALVDADRTATEGFCNPAQAAERSAPKPPLADLGNVLCGFLRDLQQHSKPTPVNRVRAKVLGDCGSAAELSPGFFSLTVPTGGGKTYASLAFALSHAEFHATHGFRRVVVAIPFTSIIEQTADAYRKAIRPLATRALIEHHSNVDPKKHTRNNELAAENWDAPLIVTTNVQLYESLFAAATTPCRKLHRLARSVIVLDEAQTIPVELLRPTVMALKELVAHYGCTVVLCTATQPALEWREREFELGLKNVRPIVRDIPLLFGKLKRVEVIRLGKLSDVDLADRLAGEPAVLCVVNTRPHAAKLYDLLVDRCGNEGCYHLSTFMCAEHRRHKLAEIRRRLREHQPCRLISTQLIEAGVDVDFPAVYRAPAGFDSVAQAAGRCNREGLLLHDNGRPALGRVCLFDTEIPAPPGLQRAAAQCGAELAGRYPDPIAPDAVEGYFRLFYWSQQHQWDKPQVLAALADDFKSKDLQLRFRTAASRYQIIRDEQTPIVVPYNDDGRALRERLLRSGDVDFALLRNAQQYIVAIRDNLLTALVDSGTIVQHDCGLWLMMNDSAYSADKGLSPGGIGIDATLMIA